MGDGIMTNKEQKIVIDGVTFQVAPFMAVEGLRLKAHLVRIFGPALGELLGGIDGTKVGSIADISLGGDGIAKGLEKLLEQLDEAGFEALVKRLLTNVIASWTEGGKSRSISFGQDFETAMQLVFLGRLFSIYELIIFVLKVNYPDFFDKVVSGIGRRMKATFTFGTEEPTPQNESGQSETSEN
jgi:uncharacterized protein YidB (DUF937 family)